MSSQIKTVNIIKAGKADCSSKVKHDCGTGQNMAGDPDAWIEVPKGQCEKIKVGDFSGLEEKVAKRIKAKLDITIEDKNKNKDKNDSEVTS